MPVTLLPATEQLAMLRKGAIAPLELAEEHIRQIQRLNPTLNALVDFDAERVRAQAAQARPGPLSGLPVTVKSSIAVKGYR
ncbi:MAG: amidase family protein, partial [Candidatus Korobacteraceae bacterium]